MKLTNLAVSEGRKIGLARGVSVRIKFEHDTGLDAGCAAPTAWLHEKRGYVDVNPGDEKQAIIAVAAVLSGTQDKCARCLRVSTRHVSYAFQQRSLVFGKGAHRAYRLRRGRDSVPAPASGSRNL